MNLIGKWSEIADDDYYVAFAVAPSRDPERGLYLYEAQLIRGWRVRQLRQGAYVAVHMRSFSQEEIRNAVGWEPKQ